MLEEIKNIIIFIFMLLLLAVLIICIVTQNSQILTCPSMPLGNFSNQPGSNLIDCTYNATSISSCTFPFKYVNNGNNSICKYSYTNTQETVIPQGCSDVITGGSQIYSYNTNIQNVLGNNISICYYIPSINQTCSSPYIYSSGINLCVK